MQPSEPLLQSGQEFIIHWTAITVPYQGEAVRDQVKRRPCVDCRRSRDRPGRSEICSRRGRFASRTDFATAKKAVYETKTPSAQCDISVGIVIVCSISRVTPPRSLSCRRACP